MKTTYARIFGIVLLLACAAPAPMLAKGPGVTMTIVIDVQGDVPAFLAMYQRIEALRQTLGLTGTSRVLHATIAGGETQHIAVAVDYADLVTFAQELPKLESNPEFQQITGESASKFRVVSRSVWTDITPQ